MRQIFRMRLIASCVVLCMPMCVGEGAFAKGEKVRNYSVDGTPVELVQSSGGNYSGIKYVGKDGKTSTLFVPSLTKAMVSHYRPRHSLYDVDEVVSEIGVVTVAENRLWFGMSFYGGEGSDGMGGVGFFDPKLNKIGILRHPALVDCSVAALQITPMEIVVLTYSQGELSSGICNGLVRINRKSLASSIQLPKGNVQTVADKDDLLNDEEKAARANYEAAGSDLIGHFKDWPSKSGPLFTGKDIQQLGSVGFDSFLLENVRLEYGWFDQAAIAGKITFDQRCRLAVNEAPLCAPPFVKQDWGKTCKGGVGECAFESMISRHLLLNSSNYGCTPSAWLALLLLDDERESGHWHVDNYLAPGRTGNPAGGAYLKEPRKVPIVIAGHRSVFIHGGKQHIFQVESVEYADVQCPSPYAQMSGPAIRSAITRMTTVDVDQTYVPAILKGR